MAVIHFHKPEGTLAQLCCEICETLDKTFILPVLGCPGKLTVAPTPLFTYSHPKLTFLGRRCLCDFCLFSIDSY